MTFGGVGTAGGAGEGVRGQVGWRPSERDDGANRWEEGGVVRVSGLGRRGLKRERERISDRPP